MFWDYRGSTGLQSLKTSLPASTKLTRRVVQAMTTGKQVSGREERVEMAEIENWGIEPIAARYFHGPQSSIENDHRTMPALLRAVADWIERSNLQDPELVSLTAAKSFIGEHDEHCETVTVYFHPPAPESQRKE